VEFVWHFVDGNYAKVPLQISINRGTKFLGPKCPLEHDTCHLTFSVHACICPTRTVNLQIPTVKQCQRASQFALYSAFSGLNLPSVKIRAIILNSQFEVHMAINQPD
jgi:hypothetical protein